MPRSNVISLADAIARREGWEVTSVEPLVIPLTDGRFELRLTDPEETYRVTGNREWMEALHARLGRALGK
jgi:hypothetical protein